MRRLYYYYVYLFLAWGSFRYFVRLPEVIEELWFKPIIWMVPLFWFSLSLKNNNRVKMFEGKWLKSIVFGLVIGLFYFVIFRRLEKMSLTISLSILTIVLATSIIEELVFSGFVTGYLEKIKKGRLMNFIIVGLMVGVLRLPILWFVYKIGITETIGVFVFAIASGAINAWIRVFTGNVMGSIVARMGLGLAVLG